MGRLLDIELHRALSASGWSRIILVGWLVGYHILLLFLLEHVRVFCIYISCTTASNATLCD